MDEKFSESLGSDLIELDTMYNVEMFDNDRMNGGTWVRLFEDYFGEFTGACISVHGSKDFVNRFR